VLTQSTTMCMDEAVDEAVKTSAKIKVGPDGIIEAANPDYS